MTDAMTPMELSELKRTLLDADECHGLVVRGGEQDACGKPPVAIVDALDREDGCFWPACAWHANRYGPSVPIADLMRVLGYTVRRTSTSVPISPPPTSPEAS